MDYRRTKRLQLQPLFGRAKHAFGTPGTGWQHFDDYLAALKTKFRVKARRGHFNRSASLERENVTSQKHRSLIARDDCAL